MAPPRLLPLLPLLLLAASCGGEGGSPAAGGPSVPVPGREGAVKSAASARAVRRAYDGAPPVIPHPDFRVQCAQCHTERGMSVPDYGFAPPMPHADTDGMSAMSRCTQCHAWRTTEALFRESTFVGLRQDLRKGARGTIVSPPVLPHPVKMRENCLSCHDGPAAREEIRCPHPERVRCVQCHVPVNVAGEFARE
ncbi:MAG: hypothetical protein HUU06_08310 [Planctomycetaceae bacterium]|nr:nitrate reductase cytochrome c-type subunit [Planctomycetota bacterium]NUN52773.1 hypothetical protein [Planctomycetaceae bacterium]